MNVTYKLRRTYEIEVHGLYCNPERHDCLTQDLPLHKETGWVMGDRELELYLNERGWSHGGLLDAATRYADMGDNDVELYLCEWTVGNDGSRALDWGRWDDIDHDGTAGGGKIHCGPVRMTARETDVEVD